MEQWVLTIAIFVIGWVVQYILIVAKQERRLTAVETKIELFWGLVEDNLTAVLKHPYDIRKDELLTKFKELNRIELMELKTYLQDDLVVYRVEKHPLVTPCVLVLAIIESRLVDAVK